MNRLVRASVLSYVASLACLAAAILLRWVLDPILKDTLPLATLYAAITVAVWVGGYRPALLVTFFGYLTCAYLFIRPRGQFELIEPQSLVGLFLYSASATVLIGVGEALRRSPPHGRKEEDESEAYSTAVTASSRDIKKQKRVEQQLLESESRYRALGESIDYGVWECDAAGRNTFVSESFLRMVGMTQSQCSDFGWGSLLHPDDAAATMAAWKECVQSAGKWNRINRFKAADGRWRHILARGVPLKDATGQLLGWTGINLDVSNMADAEQEVLRVAAESERQRRLFETVLTNTPDLAYVFDLNHRFTYANQALLKMWGKSWNEAIGKNCLELGYEPWHAAMHSREIEQVVATKKPIRGEVAFLGTNGRRQYDYIMVPVIGTEGEVEAVAGTTRDVTERKEKEDQLRRNHDTFSALIENNPFGVYAVDADFRLRQVSLGAQKVFESVRPLLGRDFAEVLRILWPEPFASNVITRFRHTLDTGEPYSAPSTIERRSDIGAIEAYDWRIERINLPDGRYGVVCYFYDLSERQKWEATLLDSEERLRLATDAAELGIWTWQPDVDTVVWENDRPYEIFAHPRNEPPLTAARFKADFLHPEDTEIFQNAFGPTQQMKRPLFCECRILRHSGEIRWVEFTGRAVDGEEKVRLIGTVQDITNRKLIEEERERLVEQLRDADRRKDEFIATLAHELRNPLAPIRNGLQVMRLAGTTGAIEETRTMMERQLVQMVRLVDDLLDVSRVTTGKLQLRRENIELRTIIEVALETTRPIILDAELEISVILPEEKLLVHGDATRLAQVVSNLLNNSAKYTNRGGQVALKVERQGSMALISVKDTGVGISRAMLDKVFLMFTQVDRTLEKTTGGLGIGLSLVKGLVEMHSGTIEARSDGEGRGSEFIVRLPLVSSTAFNVEPKNADELVTSNSRCRILVADDNVDAAESLRKLLELLGNEVSTAYNGLQAVDVAESSRPDLILLDIGMPKLNGYEAARRIRSYAWGQDTVLVALTGWGQDEDRKTSSNSGFDHHFVKPLEIAALRKLLTELHAKKRNC